MTVETRDRPRDTSDLQKRLDEIAHLESLEREGIHVDSLATEVDPTQTKVLSEEVLRVHEDQHVSSSTFNPRGIIARRRSRRVARTLMTRRHR